MEDFLFIGTCVLGSCLLRQAKTVVLRGCLREGALGFCKRKFSTSTKDVLRGEENQQVPVYLLSKKSLKQRERFADQL